MRPLTPLEARVLGVLVEKQATVPDTYPLSLNTLVAGCNQKTARDPVIAATDAEVLTVAGGLLREVTTHIIEEMQEDIEITPLTPLRSALHAAPFHWAMLVALTPPAEVNFPPA